LDERVLEDVAGVGTEAAGVHQLGVDEPIERNVELRRGHRRHPLQQSV
jgi:hypothetical protein